ncbi:MAG: hypothetical protein R6W75_12700 [Smithellaceae bacterium]
MTKLNKRQIIILCVAALFVLYAAYDLLVARSASKQDKREASPVEISSFVNDINTQLVLDSVATADAYTARRAEADWPASPFWDRTSYREWSAGGRDAAGGAAVKIIYSGFVDAGNRKMAVINGWEYAVGEQLELEGYVLKNITPSRVVIFNKNTGSELAVPIQE